MNHIIWILLLCPVAVAVTCPMEQAKNEAALAEIEKTWARALDAHDADALSCILADEFEDADVNGQVNDRSTVLAKVERHTQCITSSRISMLISMASSLT